MRRVEDAVLRVSTAFDEHMRQLFQYNHLAYIPFPPMMPLVRVMMSIDPSTSSSTVAVVERTSEYRLKLLSSLNPSVRITDNKEPVGNAVGISHRRDIFSVTK
ncbi:hypothetical protein M9H77_03539 [Catharanthus roseus]|uniref:Uncharacterized protein n=1 Tax=Catharanthus roseus TaxID=4058 RepID=A0ACC0CBJ4_CATRO|nr:hypothetical protein M9H77_03539 [Catharanthus roseus]